VRALLIVLTAVEVLLVVVVLATYLVRINRSLRTTSRYLGKVSFGVRAIETQCAPIGPVVGRINGQLAGIAEALAGVAALAAQRAGGGPGNGSRRG